jgi:hypothetical protein
MWNLLMMLPVDEFQGNGSLAEWLDTSGIGRRGAEVLMEL